MSVELVLEPRPELPERALAALRSALAARDDVERAYLLRQRRTEPGADPQLVTALSLVLAEVGEPPKQDAVVRLVMAVAEALGEDGTELAIGVPSRRALAAIERHGVLVYERGS